jgi:hypothetical protein
MNYEMGQMTVDDPLGRFVLECESSGIAVIGSDA